MQILFLSVQHFAPVVHALANLAVFLRTFDVRLETSLSLAPLIPNAVVKVSESGIHNAADVHRLMDAGYAAFLVGEHLMKSGNPAEALRTLCS